MTIAVMIPVIVALVFVSLTAASAIQIILFLKRFKRYSDPYTRLQVLQAGDSCLGLWAGELEPMFYTSFVNKAQAAKTKHLTVVFGTRLLVPAEKFDRYFAGRSSQEWTLDAFWDSHPLLRYYHDNPSNVTLYVKQFTEEQEHHFSIGMDDQLQNVCVEYPHGRLRPGGGFVSKGDQYLYTKWRERFESLVADRRRCVKVDSTNALSLFRRLEVEAANA